MIQSFVRGLNWPEELYRQLPEGPYQLRWSKHAIEELNKTVFSNNKFENIYLKGSGNIERAWVKNGKLSTFQVRRNGRKADLIIILQELISPDSKIITKNGEIKLQKSGEVCVVTCYIETPRTRDNLHIITEMRKSLVFVKHPDLIARKA